MNEFLIDCINETFTRENLEILWEERNSKIDIIKLNTDYPIRFKLNDVGTRNIELMINSDFGYYYKTIALINGDESLFPRGIDKLSRNLDLYKFKRLRFKPEIDVMIGAFSMESLSFAFGNKDVEVYEGNGGRLEMFKAFDGTMQTFVKQKNPVSMEDFSFDDRFYYSELDSVALSSFNFTPGHSSFSPTKSTKQWVDLLVPKRLLEAYSLE